MAAEPSPWHPSPHGVIPWLMAERPAGKPATVNRLGSGGTITKYPAIYAERVLSDREMVEAATIMRAWALRSKNPERKFSTKWIAKIDEVVQIWGDRRSWRAEDALPILEDFLMELRWPYANGHLTMKDRPEFERLVLDFVNTIVAEPRYQKVLLSQFKPL